MPVRSLGVRRARCGARHPSNTKCLYEIRISSLFVGNWNRKKAFSSPETWFQVKEEKAFCLKSGEFVPRRLWRKVGRYAHSEHLAHQSMYMGMGASRGLLTLVLLGVEGLAAAPRVESAAAPCCRQVGSTAMGPRPRA